MNALSIALALALAGVGAPARNRPPAAAAAEGSTASELADAEVAQRVRAYLGAIHAPASSEQWRALGARAAGVLEAIARDPQALPSRRARAVAALSHVGGEGAQRTVLELARSEAAPFAVRAGALEGAERLLAADDLAREVEPILRGATEPLVRATAAEVLARRAPESACGAVLAQAARERDAHRRSFGRALARCEPPAP